MAKYNITDEFVAEFNRLRAKVDSISGPGVVNSPTSVSHAAHPQVRAADSSLQIVTIKITGAVSSSFARYNGHLIYGTTNNNPSNLAIADLGTVASNTVEIWNLSELGSGMALKANDVVLGVLRGYNKTAGQPVYETISSTGGLIPCQVKKDGGVAGSFNTSTNCSFTYSLYDTSGNALKDSSGTAVTGITPDHKRFDNCQYNTPTDYSPGIAYKSGTTYKLYDVAQEIPSTATVTPLTSFQYSSGSWQYKKTAALVLDKKDEDSSWTNVVTGTTCP